MKVHIIYLGLALMLCNSAAAEYSAIIEQQWAIDTNTKTQKFVSTFMPEWNIALNKDFDMTVIARVKFDMQSNLTQSQKAADNYSSVNGQQIKGRHSELEIREWFIDFQSMDGYWRVGKQQVVWGQTDGLKVLDVVNPQSLREFILEDFEESRIPTWMVNVEFPIGEDDSLQLLWIPDQTYNELAEPNTSYQVTSPLLVPKLPDEFSLQRFINEKPSSVLKDSDLGIKYASFKQGWDLSLNYFYHYLDSPVFYQDVNGFNVEINAHYERSHLLGATATKAFNNLTLRTEIGYSSDSFHILNNSSGNLGDYPTDVNQGIINSAELASVVGFDWQGLSDTLISMQWFQSFLFDYQDDLVRSKSNHSVSLLYRQTFENEVWEFQALTINDLNNNDGVLQVDLSYQWQDNFKIFFGYDHFYGSKKGQFGQFTDENRLTVSVEWGI